MARSSKRRKVKQRFKFTKELLFLIIFLVAVCVGTGLLGIEKKSDKLYNKLVTSQAAVASDAKALSEDNVYKEISYRSLASKVKKDKYTYVYYGSYTEAEYMRNLETINQRAQDYDVKTVYLLSSKFSRKLDVEDEKYGEENNEIITELNKGLCEVDLSHSVQLWIFKNGEVVFNSLDYTTDIYQASVWNYVIEQAFGHFNNKD